MLIVTACPDLKCGAPAEVGDTFRLASTDGPVTCGTIRCAAGHTFKVALDALRFPPGSPHPAPVPRRGADADAPRAR